MVANFGAHIRWILLKQEADVSSGAFEASAWTKKVSSGGVLLTFCPFAVG